jgi:hypothetical protein
MDEIDRMFYPSGFGPIKILGFLFLHHCHVGNSLQLPQ